MSTIVTRAGKGSPLTNNEVDANFVNLNTDKIESITSVDGSVVISATGTTRDLSVGIAGSTATLISQVRNETGATLTKGTVVYISGAGGNKALVSKALASGDSTSAQTYGVIQADISNNQNGYVVVVGAVSGINTIAYPDGTQLYLSGTTAGTYTSTKPYAPIHLVYVGIVTYSHATQGTIQVKIQNGYEMDELHNVSAQSPSNGNTLVYNTSNSLWEKSNAPVISGGSIDNSPIGATTVSTGAFSTLTTTGTINLLTVGRGAGAVATNTAVGASALAANTTGSWNTAVGYQAGQFNTTGLITAFGSQALNSNTTGTGNVAVGGYTSGTVYAAMTFNTTGSSNTAVGAGALVFNTTASNNTAVGYQAIYNNTTGTSNTGVGYAVAGALSGANNAINNITAIGYAALAKTTGDANTAVGRLASYQNLSGTNNVSVGDSALFNNTSASFNTAVGAYAGYSNTTGSACVTAVGYQAGYNTNGGTLDAFSYQAGYSNTTGVYNVAVGYIAMRANTTGSYNTAIGQVALYSNTTGASNTAVGYQAGYSQTTGTASTFVGNQAGYSSTVAAYNTFFGQATGYNSTGSLNTFIGPNAGYYMTTGSKNTIIGVYSGNQGGLDIRTASNYIVLSDGDGNPRLYIDSGPTLNCSAVYTITSANAANVVVLSNGSIVRSTSALKYKQDIRDLEDMDISLLRPVRYKSKCDSDDQTKDHLGLIADEAADAGFEELVTRGADGEVEGFQYERLTVVLLKELQRLKAEVAALKGN